MRVLIVPYFSSTPRLRRNQRGPDPIRRIAQSRAYPCGEAKRRSTCRMHDAHGRSPHDWLERRKASTTGYNIANVARECGGMPNLPPARMRAGRYEIMQKDAFVPGEACPICTVMGFGDGGSRVNEAWTTSGSRRLLAMASLSAVCCRGLPSRYEADRVWSHRNRESDESSSHRFASAFCSVLFFRVVKHQLGWGVENCKTYTRVFALSLLLCSLLSSPPP